MLAYETIVRVESAALSGPAPRLPRAHVCTCDRMVALVSLSLLHDTLSHRRDTVASLCLCSLLDSVLVSRPVVCRARVLLDFLLRSLVYSMSIYIQGLDGVSLTLSPCFQRDMPV